MNKDKYRAWSDFSGVKQMIYSDTPYQNYKVTPFGIFAHDKHNYKYTSYTLFGENYPIMQFTKYFDKSSKEIFDGDLVKAFNKSYDSSESINTVILDKGCWKLRCKGKNDIPLFNYKTSELEIMGNIYENLELLTTL